MIIAREKRVNNIAEFILYMWELEDMIRASGFDMDEIERSIISKYRQPPEVLFEIRDWYASLIQSMKEEKIEQKGHLSFVNHILEELTDLHLRLLNHPDESGYRLLYSQARPNIEALMNKTKNPYQSEIEVCLTGLYGFLMMRLQKKEISHETTAALSTFSSLMAYLSQRFREIETGEKELP
jgi:hypothetical protein